MKKYMMIFLTALCVLFSLSSIKASAAEPRIETNQAKTLKAPVVLTKASYSSSKVQLKWDAYNHENIYKYMIVRIPFADALNNTGDEYPEGTTINYIDPDKTNYIDSVETGNAYIYAIVALIGDNEDSITHISNPDPDSLDCIAIVVSLQKPDVKVSNLSDGIKVSWNKIEGADGFNVYRKIDGKSYNYDNPIFHTTKSNVTSYTNTNFTKGTSYCYQVEPYINIKTASGNYPVAGNLSKSEFIRQLSRPAVTVSNSDDSINLSWGKISGATGYEIYRNDKYITTTTKTSWSDTKRTNGNKYTYNVRAYYEKSSLKSYSVKSSTDTIYRLSQTNIKSLTFDKKILTVKHAQNSKATGYKIEYARNKEFKNSTTKTIKGYTNSTTKIETKYSTGTYYVRVRPYKVVDDKTYYGAWCTTKSVPCLSRPAVTVSNSDTAIKLTWGKISGATGYEIYRNGKYVTSTSKTSWSDTKRTNGNKYTYNVRAYYKKSDLNSYSEKSSTDTIYRLNRTNIKKLTAGKKSLTVNHYQNSKATGYKIEYARNKNFNNSITKTVKGYKNSTTKITTNYGNATYYVRVRPYKVVNGKTYYGTWCVVNSVYVKK